MKRFDIKLGASALLLLFTAAQSAMAASCACYDSGVCQTPVGSGNTAYGYTHCNTLGCCEHETCPALVCSCTTQFNNAFASAYCTDCAVTCKSSDGGCNNYIGCHPIQLQPNAAVMGSITLGAGKSVPVEVGYQPYVREHGLVLVKDIQIATKVVKREVFADSVVGRLEQAAVMEKEFTMAQIKLLLRNDSGRAISAITHEVQIEYVTQDGKAQWNHATISRDYWRMGRVIKPGDHWDEVGGTISLAPNLKRIRLYLSFVEFDDGERVGNETTISAQRAGYKAAYARLISLYDSGTPGQDLIDAIKPAFLRWMQTPKAGPFTGEPVDIIAAAAGNDPVGWYQHFEAKSREIGIARMLAQGRAIIGDRHMIGVEDRQAQQIAEMRACSLAAK